MFLAGALGSRGTSVRVSWWWWPAACCCGWASHICSGLWLILIMILAGLAVTCDWREIGYLQRSRPNQLLTNEPPSLLLSNVFTMLPAPPFCQLCQKTFKHESERFTGAYFSGSHNITLIYNNKIECFFFTCSFNFLIARRQVADSKGSKFKDFTAWL